MKNIAVLLGLLLCLCVSSWGACDSSNYSCFYANFSGLGKACWLGIQTPGYSLCNESVNLGASCDASYGYPVKQMPGNLGSKYCLGISNPTNNGSARCNVTLHYCTTQAEADSATIAQKCATGTMVKDTVGAIIFDACKNGEGLLIAFNNPITGVHNASIGYYIVTDGSADSLDEATYNHLASLACTEVSLYRGVLNGKYVYWYSTDPEPAGVVNVVRIK